MSPARTGRPAPAAAQRTRARVLSAARALLHRAGWGRAVQRRRSGAPAGVPAYRLSTSLGSRRACSKRCSIPSPPAASCRAHLPPRSSGPIHSRAWPTSSRRSPGSGSRTPVESAGCGRCALPSDLGSGSKTPNALTRRITASGLPERANAATTSARLSSGSGRWNAAGEVGRQLAAGGEGIEQRFRAGRGASQTGGRRSCGPPRPGAPLRRR